MTPPTRCPAEGAPASHIQPYVRDADDPLAKAYAEKMFGAQNLVLSTRPTKRRAIDPDTSLPPHPSSSPPPTPSPQLPTPSQSNAAVRPDTSMLSPPLPPPTCQLSLQTLPEDVLRRVIVTSLSDVIRGCPYYPAKLPTHLLALSQASTALQTAVAPHLPSDQAWLDSDSLPYPLTPSARKFLLDWYRAARPALAELHVHYKMRSDPVMRLRVTTVLLEMPPPLRHIDLFGVLDGTRAPRDSASAENGTLGAAGAVRRDAHGSRNGSGGELVDRGEEAMDEDNNNNNDYDDDDDDDDDDYDDDDEDEEDTRPDVTPLLRAVSSLLVHVRHTLRSLRVEPLSPVVDAVASACLLSLRQLHVVLASRSDSSRELLRLARSLSGSVVTSLTLTCRTPFPPLLSPAEFAAALPCVTELDVCDSGANMMVMNSTNTNGMSSSSSSASSSAAATGSRMVEIPHAVDIAGGFGNIEKLSFQGVELDGREEHARRLWHDHRFPATQLSFVQCKFAAFPTALPPHVGPAVRRLELATQLGASDVAALATKCRNLHTVAITLCHAAARALPDALSAWHTLTSLQLSFPAALHDDPSRSSVRAAIETALTVHAGPSFHKLVLLGETLSVAAVSSIVLALGPRLEYLVTGLYTPRKSRSKSIMRVLKVIRACCPQMRVCCFGLALTYDPRADEVDSEFRRQVAKTGAKLKYLDTWWLMQNAINLKKMQRPEGFEDYVSEDEGSWDDDDDDVIM